MLKHFDSSLSFINNETKIALYIEIAKPLILCLPDINDKVKAIAWFRKIVFDNSSLLVRIEYLELLLKFLKRRKLSGLFAGLPDTRRPLQKFKKELPIQHFSGYDNKTNHLKEAQFKNEGDDGDNYFPQKSICNAYKCKYMKAIHHVNNSKHNMHCFKKSNRISAGYSPFTKREIQHHIKSIINSPFDNNEKIRKCEAMLTKNCLPLITTSDEKKLNRLDYAKSRSHDKKEKYCNVKRTPIYENYNSMFKNVLYKHNDNCIKRTGVHGKTNKTVKNAPVKDILKEENIQSEELDEFSGLCKNNELESFLMASKKYLTLCVSKECLVERNILKCVKYIISNAQCKFFKFKEYCNLENSCCMPKPKKTHDIKKKFQTSSFLNKEARRKKRSYDIPENNQTTLLNNCFLSRLRNLLINNETLANASKTFQNMLGKCIYIKISLILAVGTIFFWKFYQMIFACQCKRVGYSTQMVSQLYNLKKEVCSPYVFTFVSCFILYQFLKDFINIFSY